MRIDNASNLIYVRGQVPGPKEGVVCVKDSRSLRFFQQQLPPFPTYLPGVDGELPRIVDAPTEATDPVAMKESPNPF